MIYKLMHRIRAWYYRHQSPAKRQARYRREGKFDGYPPTQPKETHGTD